MNPSSRNSEVTRILSPWLMEHEGSGQKKEIYQRPTFAKWLSEGKFVHFERSWTIYKRSKFKDIQ